MVINPGFDTHLNEQDRLIDRILVVDGEDLLAINLSGWNDYSCFRHRTQFVVGGDLYIP